MPKVPLQGLGLSNLADGFAGRAIDAGIRAIFEDIADRGNDGKPRKLIIKLTFTPDAEDRVDIDVQVKPDMPAYRPPATQAKLDQKAGGLVFNTDCRENPDQMTLSDLDDDQK